MGGIPGIHGLGRRRGGSDPGRVPHERGRRVQPCRGRTTDPDRGVRLSASSCSRSWPRSAACSWSSRSWRSAWAWGSRGRSREPIHDLFEGTERIRQGDFTHRIPIRRRDQLGELAESFNSMTASVEDLLQQKAEKERLEQELRVARDIQMSLLPQGPVRMAGLALTAFCEPAREVGGDYYDFLPIDEHRLGVLIADVAGKGTSAALYMAELKGLMLSLSQLHRSPRALLIDANRLLSRQLDSRSFITMTYLVVDLEARTLTHARAGHCPLIYLPAVAPHRRAGRCCPRMGWCSGCGSTMGRRSIVSWRR